MAEQEDAGSHPARDQAGGQKAEAAYSMTLWRTIDSAPGDEVVITKIDDEHGKRNVQPLKRHGRLWWTPDGAMYVYYTPTHWARDAHGGGTR